MRVTLSALAALVTFATTSLAAPRQWLVGDGGNGHWYETVCTPGAISWDDARTAAIARGGDLATFTTPAEQPFYANELLFEPGTDGCWQEFGTDTAPHISGPWIGLSHPAGASGAWTWVSGEPYSFKSWYPGQPEAPEGNGTADAQQGTWGALKAIYR